MTIQTHPLFEIEEAGWRALSTSGEAAAAFYESVLDDNVTMVFPGFVVTERQQVIDSMGGAPWSSYRLEDMRTLDVDGNVTLVTYRSTSQRGDDPEYTALITTGYVQRQNGDWKLCFHQQTPS
jgi:ketosteroid isomerase-like protein